jgi:hypothetical protein
VSAPRLASAKPTPSVVVLTETVGEGPSSAARIRLGSGADCAGRGGELLAEDEEQSAELGALRLGEAGEELVLGVALRLGGAFELLFAASGDGDDVPAAVVCVAFA